MVAANNKRLKPRNVCTDESTCRIPCYRTLSCPTQPDIVATPQHNSGISQHHNDIVISQLIPSPKSNCQMTPPPITMITVTMNTFPMTYINNYHNNSVTILFTTHCRHASGDDSQWTITYFMHLTRARVELGINGIARRALRIELVDDHLRLCHDTYIVIKRSSSIANLEARIEIRRFHHLHFARVGSTGQLVEGSSDDQLHFAGL